VKKLTFFLIALAFVLSITGLPLIQEKAKAEKPPEATKSPEVSKVQASKPEAVKPETAKKKAPRVGKYRMGGLVIAMDPKVRKIKIKQDNVYRERKVNLTVSKKAAKELAGVKAGDVVNIWVTGKVITDLQRVF
jgi:N-acetylmuramoyl-L-alanine amidase CwlA